MHLGPRTWHKAGQRTQTGQEETDVHSNSALLATALDLMASPLGKFTCKFPQQMSGKPCYAFVAEGIDP